MTYAIEKDVTFEAAHLLPNHPGKCRRLHGHSYRVIARVEGSDLVGDGSARHGMLIDTAEMAVALWAVIGESLDHRYLNEVPGLENPTTEIVVRWIAERVKIPGLSRLVLEEGFTSRAEWIPARARP